MHFWKVYRVLGDVPGQQVSMVSMRAEGSGHLCSQATGSQAGLGVGPGDLDQHAAHRTPTSYLSLLRDHWELLWAHTPGTMD